MLSGGTRRSSNSQNGARRRSKRCADVYFDVPRLPEVNLVGEMAKTGTTDSTVNLFADVFQIRSVIVMTHLNDSKFQVSKLFHQQEALNIQSGEGHAFHAFQRVLSSFFGQKIRKISRSSSQVFLSRVASYDQRKFRNLTSDYTESCC